MNFDRSRVLRRDAQSVSMSLRAEKRVLRVELVREKSLFAFLLAKFAFEQVVVVIDCGGGGNVV